MVLILGGGCGLLYHLERIVVRFSPLDERNNFVQAIKKLGDRQLWNVQCFFCMAKLLWENYFSTYALGLKAEVQMSLSGNIA